MIFLRWMKWNESKKDNWFVLQVRTKRNHIFWTDSVHCIFTAHFHSANLLDRYQFILCYMYFLFSVCKSRVAFSLHLFIHFGLLLVDRTIRIYFVVALHIRRECILISSTFFSFFFILIHLDVALAHCSFATVVNPLFRSGFFFLFIISVLLRYTMY